MFHSLQARLTAGFVAIIALAILAISISIALLYAGVLRTQYETTYQSNAKAAIFAIDNRLETTLLAQLAPGAGSGYDLTANDLRGVVTKLSASLHVRIRVDSLLDNKVIAESPGPSGYAGQHLTRDDFGPLSSSAALPIQIGGVRPSAPIATTTVSDPLTDRAYQQQQFMAQVAWIAAGALLLAIVLAGLLSERLTAPFRVLTRATARIGAGDLSERVPEGRVQGGRRDEAGELAHQFNHMAGRLGESFALLSAERDHLRQFVADVSHELRTPLTALRTFNDLLRDGAGEDAVTRREFLDAGAQQIERMEWLTRNLLDLSRLEAGLTRIVPQQADLSATLRRVVTANNPAAAVKKVALTVDAPPLMIMHDAPRLEQALGNLLGNAIKFSPHGGVVRVRLCAEALWAVVEVGDEGPGIPPHEIPHVFERFYRGRHANRAGDGSGLGLAITKAIVEAHGGRVLLESDGTRGTTIWLSLPLTAPSPDEAWDGLAAAPPCGPALESSSSRGRC